MNFQTLNKQRKFILIASVLGIISVFLPWVTVSVFGLSHSVNGFQGWGVFIFLLFIVSLFNALAGNQVEPLSGTSRLVAVGCGVLAILSTLMAFRGARYNLDGGLGLVDVNVGIGCISSGIVSAATILFSLIFKKSDDSLKKSIEGLKKSIVIPVKAVPGTRPTVQPADDRIAQLEKLVRMKESGSLSEEEFQQMKSRLV